MPLQWRSLLHRTRRRNVTRSLYDKPARERHSISFVCSILSVIVMIVSLSLPEWATSGSTDCNCVFGLTRVTCVDPLSLSGQCTNLPMTSYYKTPHEILISCVLSISVLTIISSVIAAVISCGYPREKFEFIRHFSVFNIVSMLCIILVGGFWLAVCETLPISSSTHNQSAYRNTVKFGYAYYMYMSSGLFSLVAASLNLLRARSAAERRRHHRRNYRQRFLFRAQPPPSQTLSQAPTRPHPSGSTGSTQDNQEETEEPPEYTQMATTSFIEDPPNSSDTDALLNPPPYAP